jgi:hypothetical protein
MNITGSNSPSTMNQSILKLANQQPELALQLLQKSLEGSTLQSSQASSQAASPVTAQTSSRIDIRV